MRKFDRKDCRQQKLKRSTWPWRFNLSGYLIISLDQKKFVSWSQSWYQKSVNIKKNSLIFFLNSIIIKYLGDLFTKTEVALRKSTPINKPI